MRTLTHRTLLVVVLIGATLACHRPKPAIDQSVARAEPKPSANQATPAPIQTPAPVVEAQPNPMPTVPAPADVAAPAGDATRSPSGVVYKVLRQGRSQERPRAWDLVEFAYTGWTTSGVMFATTQNRYEPAEMTIDRMIPAWRETLPQMRVGERRRIWVPEAMAAQGGAGMPAGMLIFDIELLEIERRPRPPRAPKDAGEAPTHATRTESGLAFRVLRKGRGKLHPSAADRVRIHFDGFTADGTLFDSTHLRGMTDTISIRQIIPGMREALLQMVEGEQLRCWIPASLGYVERADGPAGALLVDLELLQIVPSS